MRNMCGQKASIIVSVRDSGSRHLKIWKCGIQTTGKHLWRNKHEKWFNEDSKSNRQRLVQPNNFSSVWFMALNRTEDKKLVLNGASPHRIRYQWKYVKEESFGIPSYEYVCVCVGSVDLPYGIHHSQSTILQCVQFSNQFFLFVLDSLRLNVIIFRSTMFAADKLKGTEKKKIMKF